jgi:hypothetical protein
MRPTRALTSLAIAGSCSPSGATRSHGSRPYRHGTLPRARRAALITIKSSRFPDPFVRNWNRKSLPWRCDENIEADRRLIGPTLVVVAAALLLNLGSFPALAQQVSREPALLLLSGILLFVSGLAIVRAHNVWTGGWAVLVTAIGVAHSPRWRCTHVVRDPNRLNCGRHGPKHRPDHCSGGRFSGAGYPAYRYGQRQLSLTTSSARLSSRRPRNRGCRSFPRCVHSVKSI